MRQLLTLALLAATGLAQAADTRYVTDQLEATLRTGESVTHRITKMLPSGTAVEVLVTREQNADGMVTVSARALALRQSWEKVRALEKEGKVVQVKVNGFNRGGVTCDLEGLRGFIPRSQLQDGENHEALVGKTLGVAFLEVNADTRKLVLSEKKAATAALFQNLEVGQLVEGQVAAVKPYGLFIDLGGISGLLHQSAITGGQLRDLREVFGQGDRVKALITELDPGRGRGEVVRGRALPRAASAAAVGRRPDHELRGPPRARRRAGERRRKAPARARTPLPPALRRSAAGLRGDDGGRGRAGACVGRVDVDAGSALRWQPPWRRT